MNKDFWEKGYIVLKNVFSKEEINTFKKEILDYNSKNKQLKNAGGVSIPDFLIKNGFENTKKAKDNEKIQEALKEIFNGTNFRFCSHNDIGINRVVGWHKDKLNGEYDKYETINIWETKNGEKHEIVKVLIYLQNHNDNNDGLKLVPKSHLNPKIETSNWIQVKPKIGDVLIFDQRITHRGMDKQVLNSRILVSFGFGKNNLFTDNFEKGTIHRQNKQNNLCLKT